MKKWIAVVFVFSALLCAVSASADGLKAGDAVTFGRYGEAPVEWTVLETQGDKALLLSRYLLDMKWFNLVYDGASWEESSVRSWLNGEFLRAAFSAEERAAILLTDVDNSDAQGCAECKDAQGGNSTQDYLFLLSYHEAFDLYFSDDGERVCVPTDYAAAHGAYSSSYDDDAGWWWLRSPGYWQSEALVVNTSGKMYSEDVDHGGGCVRPALWVDTASEGFRTERANRKQKPAEETDAPWLAGTWFGFEAADAGDPDVSDFRMYRFDPEEGRFRYLRAYGYGCESGSCAYRVSGDTLICTWYDEDYDEEWETEIGFRLVDGHLLIREDGYNVCSLVRTDDSLYPEDPENSPYMGEEARWFFTPAEDGTLQLIFCASEAGTVEVPAEAFGLPVTAVRREAFYCRESLQRVVLPDSVTIIGKQAFDGCEMLESIHLPDSLVSIEYCAFQYCYSLKEIVVPEGTERIGDEAFYSCGSLASVTLPASLKEIGGGAFDVDDPLGIVFTVTSGSYAEKYCQENGYRYLSLNPDGTVAKDASARVYIREYLYDGIESPGMLFYAGDEMLENGVDPQQVLEEMRMVAEENGVSDLFRYACENIAASESEGHEALMERRDDDTRWLRSDIREGLEEYGDADTYFSVYDTYYVSDAMKELLADSGAEYCVEPFIWTESDFEDYYGTAFSQFRPARPRPGYVCVVVRDSAKCGVDLPWDTTDDYRSSGFVYLLCDLLERFHYGVMTGNPQLASAFWVFDISWPFYAYYGTDGEVKGYSCRLTLSLMNAEDHKTAEKYTYTNVLEDTIYDWHDGIAEADIPEFYELEELDAAGLAAFDKKVRAYFK